MQIEHDSAALLPIGFQPGDPKLNHSITRSQANAHGGGDGFKELKAKTRKKRGRQFLWWMWLKGVPVTNQDIEAVLQPGVARDLWNLNKGQRIQLANRSVSPSAVELPFGSADFPKATHATR